MRIYFDIILVSVNVMNVAVKCQCAVESKSCKGDT